MPCHDHEEKNDISSHAIEHVPTCCLTLSLSLYLLLAHITRVKMSFARITQNSHNNSLEFHMESIADTLWNCFNIDS